MAKNDFEFFPENARKSLKVFDNWLRTGKKWLRIIAKTDTVAEIAKNVFKCLKMHSNVYSPKRAK